MKKLIVCAGVAMLVFAATNVVAVNKFSSAGSPSDNENPSVTIGESEWMKSESQTWAGLHEGKKTWYKLNTKDASLWWSTDEGKTWAAVPNGMWQDKEGKWLKINEGKLVWSADGGKTWVEVPDWTWQDSDGTWCKFDKDWNLWTKK